MKIKFFKLINFFFLIFGIYIIYSLCSNIGWGIILDKILSVKVWQIGIILLLPLFWNILHSLSWHILLDSKKDFNLRQLFQAHLSASAVSEVIPLGQAGGESYRIYYLKKKYENHPSVNSPDIYASVILYNTIHTFSTLLILALGFLFMFTLVDLNLTQKILAFGILFIVFLLLLYFVRKQKNGMMIQFFNLLKRFKIFKSFAQKKLPKAVLIDTRLSQFYSSHKKHFYFSYFLLFTSKLIGVLEIFLILWFIGHPVSVSIALFVFTGKSLAQILLFFFPGQIGATEGSFFYLFSLLGLNPVLGVTSALFIRLRTILWTIIGVLIAYFTGPSLFQNKIKPSKQKSSLYMDNKAVNNAPI